MAARFLVAGGSGLWNNVNNWSLTSGGASGASFPIAGDDVVLDALSAAAPLTVNVASASLSLTGTGYTGTLTVTNVLTLTGNLTLAPGMVVTGAGTLALTGTATVTTGGLTIGCALSMTATATYTLVDNFAVTGLLTLGGPGSSLTTTFTGAFTITANGGLMQGGTSSIVAASGSTPTIKIGATGTITGTNNTSAAFRLNLTIDAAGGTVTFANVLLMFGGTNVPVLTYVSGTVVQAGSGSTLQINAACTLTTAGIVWNKIITAGAFTVTSTNDVTVSGLVTFGTTVSALVLNGANWRCGGGIIVSYTSGSISGTTVIMVTGAGTLDSSAVWTGKMSNPLVINAPGAAIVITSEFNVDLGLVLFLAAASITTTQGAWVFPASGGGGGLLSVFAALGNLQGRTNENGALMTATGAAGTVTGPPTNFPNAQGRVDDDGALLVAVGTVGALRGPRTPLGMLRVRSDDTGALKVASVTAGVIGPPTDLANLQVRTDENGALLVAAGAAGTLAGTPSPMMNLRGRADDQGALIVVTTASAQTYAQKIAADGATHYWPLNETSGTTATDVIGGLNGTISAGVTLDQAGSIAGSRSMLFDAVGEYVSIPTSLPIGTGAFSFEFWFNSSEVFPGTTPFLFDNGGGAVGVGFSFLRDAAMSIAFKLGNGVVQFLVGYAFGTPFDGAWHHAVGVLTRGTPDVAVIYLDGVAGIPGNPPANGWNLTSALPLLLSTYSGGQGSATFRYAGLLDEVAFYPLALTPTQIAAHYAFHL